MYHDDYDYRFDSKTNRFKRRDGKYYYLPRPRYLLMRYTWRLSHYAIWTRLDFEYYNR